MNHPFQIISDFLELTRRDDVEGRASSAVPEELAVKLHAMAAGLAGEREREEVTLLLKSNPGWVAELAQLVKAMRTAADDHSPKPS